MSDIGPSLAKMRREWRAEGAVDAPYGMIARRVVEANMRTMKVGASITIERMDARTFRISKG